VLPSTVRSIRETRDLATLYVEDEEFDRRIARQAEAYEHFSRRGLWRNWGELELCHGRYDRHAGR
jgi:hypothetical protein